MIDPISLEKIFQTILKNGGSFADLFCESTETCTIVCDDDRIEEIVAGNDYLHCFGRRKSGRHTAEHPGRGAGQKNGGRAGEHRQRRFCV